MPPKPRKTVTRDSQKTKRATKPRVKPGDSPGVPISLRQVRLVESYAKLNIVKGVVPTEFTTKVAMNLGFNAADKLVLGNLTVHLSPTEDAEDPSNGKSSLEVKVVMQCVCDSSVDVSTLPEDHQKQISATLVLVSWPYARAFIQNVTSSMAITPVTLPLMRVDGSRMTSDLLNQKK